MEAFSEKTVTLRKVPASILECPVCCDIPMQGKIFQCKNGHIVCETCNRQLSSIPKCPSCRVTISEAIQNRALESVLEFMETKCPFSEQGCSAVIPKNAVSLHSKECLYRTVAICEMLGFSDCDYALFDPNDTANHLIEKHGVSRGVDDFFTFDFAYPSESAAQPSDLRVTKLFGSHLRYSRITTAIAQTPPHNHQPLSFLFLLKHDEKSNGLLGLCLFIGSSLKESTEFRTAFYFTSANVPKCVASWPVLWYKDPKITGSEDGTFSLWDHAYHISAQTLRIIQGQEKSINLLVRIRDAGRDGQHFS